MSISSPQTLRDMLHRGQTLLVQSWTLRVSPLTLKPKASDKALLHAVYNVLWLRATDMLKVRNLAALHMRIQAFGEMGDGLTTASQC